MWSLNVWHQLVFERSLLPRICVSTFARLFCNARYAFLCTCGGRLVLDVLWKDARQNGNFFFIVLNRYYSPSRTFNCVSTKFVCTHHFCVCVDTFGFVPEMSCTPLLPQIMFSSSCFLVFCKSSLLFCACLSFSCLDPRAASGALRGPFERGRRVGWRRHGRHAYVLLILMRRSYWCMPMCGSGTQRFFIYFGQTRMELFV